MSDEASIEGQLSALSGPLTLFSASGALEINGARPKSLSQLTQSVFSTIYRERRWPCIDFETRAALLPKDRPSQFAALSARVGSIGDNKIGGWYSYRAAKAALNQIIHTGAIELARTHKQAVCVALHPGTVQTPFTAKYLGRHPSVPASQAALNLLSVLDLGPDKTGQFLDWEGTRAM